jgi:endoglucanase
MKNAINLSLPFLLFICFTGCKKSNKVLPGGGIDTGNDSIAYNLLRCKGTQIIDSAGNTVNLQGVAFGNEVWSNNGIPATHHNELDFQRVQAMHMNAIRFYLNYRTFEDDTNPYQYKEEGFEWIDKNIAWAKKYGIYLILNMHAPQGGYQSQGTGDALWNTVSNQDRLTALWKAIAIRYKNEKQIAGYGFINEPVPTTSMQQWSALVQRITDAVRNQKDKHIIFAEKAIYVKGAAEDGNLNFPVLSDNNTAYELHIYDPIPYTHQLFDWSGQADGGKYPDENIISYSNTTWYTAVFNNPAAATGNSDWNFYEGEKYKVIDKKIKLGVPALVGQTVQGKIYFDNIIIKEYNPDGSFSRTVMELNPQSADGWGYWSANNSGSYGFSASTGSGDATSLYIQNATGDCNVSNYQQVFQPKQNYYYQASGYMKGESVSTAAACRIRIDFLTTEDPILPRNKTYLESVLSRYINWSKTKNAPLYVGEFGAGTPCFQNDKGGLYWVTDMLDILMTYNISFTYHSYHEDSFGLYYGYGSLPDPANVNQPLINLFTQKLQ